MKVSHTTLNSPANNKGENKSVTNIPPNTVLYSGKDWQPAE